MIDERCKFDWQLIYECLKIKLIELNYKINIKIKIG